MKEYVCNIYKTNISKDRMKRAEQLSPCGPVFRRQEPNEGDQEVETLEQRRKRER